MHALLGENGAGKSTLMNILYGLYSPDEGEILINGQPVRIASPGDAIARGIGMVHQHFMLIPVMSSPRTSCSAVEPRRDGVLLDYKSAREPRARTGLVLRLRDRPGREIEDISVGQQQRVEILKALYRRADILILDEPTAVLTPQEAVELFGILKNLQREGLSIIFISHKLNEVLEIAERVTVLRRGKVIETVPTAGATEEELARRMVGRDVVLRIDKSREPAGRPDPRGRGPDREGRPRPREGHGVSFEVRGGRDRGDRRRRRERPDRADRRDHGSAPPGAGPDPGRGPRRHERERDAALRRRRRARARGPAAPGPRARVLPRGEHRAPRLPQARRTPGFGWLYPKRLVERATRLIREFDVRGGGPRDAGGALSGGNQQKVILAREIDRDPRVLVAAQPTRGLDVGAIEFVHRRLVEERDEGRAVLLVSLELEEVLSLADRILVIYEGEFVGEFPPTATEEELGVAMTGGGKREIAA